MTKVANLDKPSFKSLLKGNRLLQVETQRLKKMLRDLRSWLKKDRRKLNRLRKNKREKVVNKIHISGMVLV